MRQREDEVTKTRTRRGLYLSARPRSYPLTPQQQRLRRVARECGIRPGIAKADLMVAMRDCVGPKMRGERDAGRD